MKGQARGGRLRYGAGARGAVVLGMVAAAMAWSSSAYAGATIQFGDNRSLSVGIGMRASFDAQEDGAGSRGTKWSKDFNLDNARIYLSGQLYKWLKAELNTECVFCGNSSLQEFVVLDAIAKIEPSPYFNIWGGRVLVPADRVEMDGPFYGNVYENFKTPFYPADFSVKFGSGGAGVYDRDHGVNIWGNAGGLKYVFGVFNGLRGGTNPDHNPLFATRIAYQFLDVEDNPAYYTSSTYYGGANVLTLGFALQYQEDGAGSALHKGKFLGLSVDGLYEQPLAGAGTITAEGEFKHFDSGYDKAAFSDADNFGMFDGDAFTGTALYMLPNEVGVGKLQPYARFTQINPEDSSDRNEFEFGINYIMAGHNAKVALFFQHGDLATKSIVNFAPGVSGDKVSALKLGIQLQI